MMNVLHMVIGIISCAALLSGCSVILGKDDGGLMKGASLRHVETLRNEASMRGQSLRDMPRDNNATTSLQQPNDVFADTFRVYATDLRPARVFIFERGDRTVTILDGAAPPMEDQVKLMVPSGIVVDGTGTIWIADSQQAKVFGYTRNGLLIQVIGKMGEVGKPTGLAVDPRKNRLYVADAAANVVKVFSIDGTFVRDIGANVPPREGFKFPGAVCLDAQGNLFVLDTHFRRVQSYDREGKFLRTVILSDATPGMVIKPKGIAVDSGGNLFVTDAGSNNVLVFDKEGEFQFTWGRTGTQSSEFFAPAGIFIDERDYIYIADQMNGRISVYQNLK